MDGDSDQKKKLCKPLKDEERKKIEAIAKKYSREPEWRGPVTDIHGNNFWQQGSMSAISSISVEEKKSSSSSITFIINSN